MHVYQLLSAEQVCKEIVQFTGMRQDAHRILQNKRKNFLHSLWKIKKEMENNVKMDYRKIDSEDESSNTELSEYSIRYLVN